MQFNILALSQSLINLFCVSVSVSAGSQSRLRNSNLRTSFQISVSLATVSSSSWRISCRIPRRSQARGDLWSLQWALGAPWGLFLGQNTSKGSFLKPSPLTPFNMKKQHSTWPLFWGCGGNLNKYLWGPGAGSTSMQGEDAEHSGNSDLFLACIWCIKLIPCCSRAFFTTAEIS